MCSIQLGEGATRRARSLAVRQHRTLLSSSAVFIGASGWRNRLKERGDAAQRLDAAVSHASRSAIIFYHHLQFTFFVFLHDSVPVLAVLGVSTAPRAMQLQFSVLPCVSSQRRPNPSRSSAARRARLMGKPPTHPASRMPATQSAYPCKGFPLDRARLSDHPPPSRLPRRC